MQQWSVVQAPKWAPRLLQLASQVGGLVVHSGLGVQAAKTAPPGASGVETPACGAGLAARKSGTARAGAAGSWAARAGAAIHPKRTINTAARAVVRRMTH